MSSVIQMDEARNAGLSADQLSQLLELLEEQRSTLLERASELGEDIEELLTLTATHGQGETDQISNTVDREVTARLEAGTLTALEEVAFALARIDDGSYGICASCGVPIGVDRLFAVPQTPHCVRCRQAHERGR